MNICADCPRFATHLGVATLSFGRLAGGETCRPYTHAQDQMKISVTSAMTRKTMTIFEQCVKLQKSSAKKQVMSVIKPL